MRIAVLVGVRTDARHTGHADNHQIYNYGSKGSCNKSADGVSCDTLPLMPRMFRKRIAHCTKLQNLLIFAIKKQHYFCTHCLKKI
jgi:hypothetical protein